MDRLSAVPGSPAQGRDLFGSGAAPVPREAGGRQPSLASRRTCSLACLAQADICSIMRASWLMIKGLTANSEEEKTV